MHPSRTPHHAYQTPVRDPGGLFSFVLIFLSVPNFQWMKGYFRLAHMHSLIFSCLSLSPYRKLLSFDQYICLLISNCFEDYGVFQKARSFSLSFVCVWAVCLYLFYLLPWTWEPKLFSNHFIKCSHLSKLGMGIYRCLLYYPFSICHSFSVFCNNLPIQLLQQHQYMTGCGLLCVVEPGLLWVLRGCDFFHNDISDPCTYLGTRVVQWNFQIAEGSVWDAGKRISWFQTKAHRLF